MISLPLIRVDSAIYWKRVGANEQGFARFAPPTVIQCRWDEVTHATSGDDVVDTETKSNRVFPDRVLVVGSFLCYGGEGALNELTPEQIVDPRKVKWAREVKSQSLVFEFGWEPEDEREVKPDYQSDHLSIVCDI